MTRNPARLGRADSNHKAIAQAIRLLGFPVMDLSHAGGGVEDLLVGLKLARYGDDPDHRWWLVCECKVARNKRGEATPSQFKPAQKKWREQTQGWPRITVTSAQDAVEQIRRMTG
jgi:hypothetical protein